MATTRITKRNQCKWLYTRAIEQLTRKGHSKSKIDKLIQMTLRNQYFEKGITYNKKRFGVVDKLRVATSLNAFDSKGLKRLMMAFGIIPKSE